MPADSGKDGAKDCGHDGDHDSLEMPAQVPLLAPPGSQAPLRLLREARSQESAFDAHLIGIDPDYRLHVSDRLLSQHDGPMLEALKRLNGGSLHLPSRAKDWPDRDRLAIRFERFKTLV